VKLEPFLLGGDDASVSWARKEDVTAGAVSAHRDVLNGVTVLG